MYAEISRWLPNDYAGALMRKMARDVLIRDDRDNCTYANGLLHSFDDQPAVVHLRVWRTWYTNGKRHRIDGPAVIHTNSSQQWWLNDRRHRVDGPAVIYDIGHIEYWIDGERL